MHWRDGLVSPAERLAQNARLMLTMAMGESQCHPRKRRPTALSRSAASGFGRAGRAPANLALSVPPMEGSQYEGEARPGAATFHSAPLFGISKKCTFAS